MKGSIRFVKYHPKSAYNIYIRSVVYLHKIVRIAIPSGLYNCAAQAIYFFGSPAGALISNYRALGLDVRKGSANLCKVSLGCTSAADTPQKLLSLASLSVCTFRKLLPLLAG